MGLRKPKCANIDFAMVNIRTDAAFAVRLMTGLDGEGFPAERAWETAPPVSFCADWQGKHADPQRETQLRLLWTHETLFLRFIARYRTITVFTDADANGRRDQLWDRDVCEAFLQPHGSKDGSYKEIEVAPNGLWIDLDIAPGGKHDLRSGLRRRVQVEESDRKWQAVLALPMKTFVERLELPTVWRANFFRVEGASEPRFYSAWRPTDTPQPNFHVPQAFGALVFTEAGEKIKK
jgi:alpha-galactosidase